MNVYIDPHLMRESGAVIYTPSQKRKRFPENCVRLVASEDEARSGAKPDEHFHAAVVIGPSKSSEGFRMYYLVRWL